VVEPGHRHGVVEGGSGSLADGGHSRGGVGAVRRRWAC
jgi:hypothetical protein